MRVQKHALQTQLRELCVQRLVTVLVIAQHRVAAVGRVHTDLVRTPGMDDGLDQRGFGAVVLDQLEFSQRILALRVDLTVRSPPTRRSVRSGAANVFMAEIPSGRRAASDSSFAPRHRATAHAACARPSHGA